jgi:hypothetical protein
MATCLPTTFSSTPPRTAVPACCQLTCGMRCHLMALEPRTMFALHSPL